MSRQQLPIWRDANRLLVEVETKECLSFIPSYPVWQFAGRFRGQLGARLQEVLDRFLSEYGVSFPNIRCVKTTKDRHCFKVT